MLSDLPEGDVLSMTDTINLFGPFSNSREKAKVEFIAYGDIASAPMTPIPNPEPSTWLLLAAGLAGLAVIGRKRSAGE